MHNYLNTIRIWPIAITVLLLSSLILTGPGQPQNVCAEAIFQPVSQNIFSTQESEGSMASQRFLPPSPYHQVDSPDQLPLWYPVQLLPTTFDWRDYGVTVEQDLEDPAFTDANVTAAKDQGQCNSCYAFSASGAVESFLARIGLAGNDIDISENNIKNCYATINESAACEGGDFEGAVNWLNQKGTVHEADDPYQAIDAACNTSANFRHTILGWLRIGEHNEFPDPTAIKNYLINYGPLEVSVKADNSGPTGQRFMNYDGIEPIYIPLDKSEGIDHSVTLIGWNDDTPHAGGTGVWIIKNSWGTDWGKDGTAEVAYGSANLLLGWSNVPFQSQPYDSSGELLFYDVYGASKGTYDNFDYAMVRFTPPQDSCVDRIELQLLGRATDIDIVLYDGVTPMDEVDDSGSPLLNPADKLAEILDKSSVTGGNYSFQLPAPVRLTKDDDIYVAISTQPGLMSADAATSDISDSGRSYISYDGTSWQQSQYAHNIRLRTQVCAPTVPVGPTPTNTPFVPIPTATAPPTAMPLPTIAPDQPTATPASTVSTQTLCEAPLQMQAMAASAEEQAIALPLKAKPLAPERYSSGRFERFQRSQPLLVQPPSPPRLLGVTSESAQVTVSDNPTQEREYFTGRNADVQLEPNTTGTILLPEGGPGANVSLYIYEVDGEGNPYGDPLFVGESDGAGQFGFHLIKGRYLLIADPPLEDVLGFPLDGVQSLEHLFEVGGAESEVSQINLGSLILPATTKVVRGNVAYGDGTPVFDTRVEAFNSDTGQSVYVYPNNDGSFELQVGGGSWRLTLLPWLGVTWVSVDVSQLVQFELNTTDETRENISFQVKPADAIVVGKVADPSGQPLTSEAADAFGVNFNVRFDLFDAVTERFAFGYLDASGTFTIPLLSGLYEGTVWADENLYPQFTSPILPEAIQVTTGRENIGQIRLLANNALVSGIVRNPDGLPVPNIFVDIWQNNGLSRSGITDDKGFYEIAAPSGEWWAEPSPQPYQASIFTGKTQLVTLDATTPAQADFLLEPSAGRLSGILIDGKNELLSNVDAYVYIKRNEERASIVSVPLENGRFSVKVPYGDLRVGLSLGPDSQYVLTQEAVPEVSAASGFSVTLKVVETDATVKGQLRDTEGVLVTGINGYVVAIEQDRPQNWKRSPITPADGSYSLQLFEGTWNLAYELEISEDDQTFIAYSQSEIAVEAQKEVTVTQDLTVTKSDSVISGIVVNENDNPVPNSLVWLRLDEYETSVRADENGEFLLRIPAALAEEIEAADTDNKGRRTASAGKPPRGRNSNRHPRQFVLEPNLPSEVLVLELDDESSIEDIKVVLRSANAYITGQVLDFNEEPVANARISGVNYQDAQVYSTLTDANGCFSAPIKADGDYEWQITARYQSADGFRMESKFTLAGNAPPLVGQTVGQVQASALGAASSPLSQQRIANIPVSSAIVMEYKGIIPDAKSQTFPVQSGWSHTMPDGFTIEIPPNAINTQEADVNIRLTPKQRLNETYLHSVVGYGYDIILSDSSGRLISDQFQTDVLITMAYVQGDVGDEEALIVGHYSSDYWHKEQQFVQDTENNRFSVSIGKPGLYSVLTLNQIELPEATEPPAEIPASQTPTPTNTPISATLTGRVEANMDAIDSDEAAIWTIHVTNLGQALAQDVALMVQLPPGTQISETSLAEGWTLEENGARTQFEEANAPVYRLVLGTLEGGESVSKLFAVTLLPESGMATIPEPHFLLQSETSATSLNISAGLGNTIDINPVSTAPEEEEELNQTTYRLYLPVMAQ